MSKRSPTSRSTDSTALKFLLLLVVVATAYGIYIYASGGSYGIGTKHPLGSFAQIDRHLTQVAQLEKTTISRVPHAGIPATASMYLYRIPDKADEHLIIQLDDAENVVGIVGVYVERHFGPAFSAIANISRTYWGLTGGPQNPDFTVQGRGSQRVVTSRFNAASVAGTWRKTYAPRESELIYLRRR